MFDFLQHILMGVYLDLSKLLIMIMPWKSIREFIKSIKTVFMVNDNRNNITILTLMKCGVSHYPTIIYFITVWTEQSFESLLQFEFIL